MMDRKTCVDMMVTFVWVDVMATLVSGNDGVGAGCLDTSCVDLIVGKCQSINIAISCSARKNLKQDWCGYRNLWVVWLGGKAGLA